MLNPLVWLYSGIQPLRKELRLIGILRVGRWSNRINVLLRRHTRDWVLNQSQPLPSPPPLPSPLLPFIINSAPRSVKKFISTAQLTQPTSHGILLEHPDQTNTLPSSLLFFSRIITRAGFESVQLLTSHVCGWEGTGYTLMAGLSSVQPHTSSLAKPRRFVPSSGSPTGVWF